MARFSGDEFDPKTYAAQSGAASAILIFLLVPPYRSYREKRCVESYVEASAKGVTRSFA
jgi:hypothetical protein